MTGFDLILIALLGLLALLALFTTDSPGPEPREHEDAFENAGGIPGLTACPRRLVRQCGFPPEGFCGSYWLAKVILALLAPLVLVELAQQRLPGDLVLLGAGAAGFFLSDLWLMWRRRKRRQQIEHRLSYFVDLIVAYLLAGLNLENAFMRAARFGFSQRHPLADEAKLVAAELENGRDRYSAFQSMAERTGVQDLYRLAAVLRSGGLLGASIGNTLQQQADLLRAKRWETAVKTIHRKTLASMLPLLLVSFPIFFILYFFPAVVEMLETFRFVGDLY